MLRINGNIFGSEYFDNKEVIYKDVGVEAPVTIQLNWEDTRDLANLSIATQYIRERLGENVDITLIIPYLPYSGMDREINEQLFSLKHIAGVINAMHFTKVVIRDPHNKEVTAEYVHNVEFEGIQHYVDQVIDEVKPEIIFFPDKGAYKKYSIELDTHGIPVMHGEKGRDLKDRGHINKYTVADTDVDVTGKKVLIIDDICRKGGTFMGAGNSLKELGAAEVYLYVTHCEVSILLGKTLLEGSPLSGIWTTDSEVELMEKLPKWKETNKTTVDIHVVR